MKPYDTGMQEPARLPSDWPNRRAGRSVRAGGLDWHVQRAGEGPPLLLLHGSAASTHSWAALLPLLAASFDVLAPDLPGHGFTVGAGRDDLSLRGMTARVADLLEAESFRPGVVVGHSAGAAVGAALVLRREAGALVGLNPALGGVGEPDLPVLVEEPLKELLKGSLPARAASALVRNTPAIRWLLESTGSEVPRASIRRYRELLSDPTRTEAVFAMMSGWSPGWLTRSLPRLSAPALFVVGGKDRWTPAEGIREVAGEMPAARLAELPDAGHLAHEEAPEEVARLIASFVRETASGG